MGTVTVPAPLAILVLIGPAMLALFLLGAVVLALLATRDGARLRYLEKVGRMQHELDVARGTATRRH